MGLYSDLMSWNDKDVYPFHMPGHKRQNTDSPLYDVERIDITEIDGFDSLHVSTGILLKAQERVSKLYGSRRSFYLVNGSTCGILSAIASATCFGDSILIARNCHKSAYNAITTLGLKPIYLLPEISSDCDFPGAIVPADVSKVLEENEQVKAVIITSPTYEGIVSDILSIADIAHQRGIPLIVDSAHGAHIGIFNGEEITQSMRVPQGAVECNADIVIQSAHKTLPAMTQTAILHFNSELISEKFLRDALQTYQTSSPSYVLMASLDECFSLIERDGRKLFEKYYINLQNFYSRAEKLRNLEVFTEEKIKLRFPHSYYSFDSGKIIVSGRRIGMTGRQLYDILRRYHRIQPEMFADGYTLCMTSIMDREDAFERLIVALEEIDAEVEKCETVNCQATELLPLFYVPEAVKTSFEVHEFLKSGGETELVDFSASEGRVSAEYMFFYPPGIPVLVPGERIDARLLQALEERRQNGGIIRGLQDETANHVIVIA